LFALRSPPALQVGPGFHVPVGVTVCTAACEVEEDKEAESVSVVEELVVTADVVVVVVVVVGTAGVVVVVVVVVGTAGVVVVVVVVVGPLVATLPPVSVELDELDEPVVAGTVEDVTTEEV
jgi:hypothetical protein